MSSPHKGPVTRKMFPFNDVIIYNDMIIFVQSSKSYSLPGLNVLFNETLIWNLDGFLEIIFLWNHVCWWDISSSYMICQNDISKYPSIRNCMKSHHRDNDGCILWNMKSNGNCLLVLKNPHAKLISMMIIAYLYSASFICTWKHNAQKRGIVSIMEWS